MIALAVCWEVIRCGVVMVAVAFEAIGGKVGLAVMMLIAYAGLLSRGAT